MAELRNAGILLTPGVASILSSNEITDFPMTEGDMIWIVDDSGRPLSSASGGPFAPVKILESCAGFAPE